MKRLFIIFLTLALCISLSACQFGNTLESAAPSVSVADSTEAPSGSGTQESSEESTEKETAEATTEKPDLYLMDDRSVQVYRDNSGAVWAMFVVQVTNISDAPLALGSADFTFQDESGKERSMWGYLSVYPPILAPGETGYYCDVMSLDVSDITSMTFTKTNMDISPADDAPVRYELSQIGLKDTSYDSLELSATVSNNTQSEGELVCVCAILKGADGEFLGFITNYLDGSLPAGASQSITFESFMLPPDLSSDQVAEIVTFAFPV